jgi:hypothetical protein
MRTHLFFNEVDASVSVTSDVLEFECGQDARFLLHIRGTGLNGTPRIVIEEANVLADNVWSPLEDTSTWGDYFELNQQLITVKDSYIMGRYLRIRIVANGNTTGTIWAKMGYKTKV